MKPFPRTYPELEIIGNHPVSVEYRLYNYSLAKDGSNIIRRRNGYSMLDLAQLAGVYASWYYLEVLNHFCVYKISYSRCSLHG